MTDWNAVAFFCDDIRHEVNGVDTVVGVLPDNVAIPAVPAMLPKLGIYTRLHVRPESDVRAASVRVDFFDGAHKQSLGSFDEEAVKREKETALKAGKPLVGFIFRATLSPIPVPQYGRVVVWIDINGKEEICGSLNFVAP